MSEGRKERKRARDVKDGVDDDRRYDAITRQREGGKLVGNKRRKIHREIQREREKSGLKVAKVASLCCSSRQEASILGSVPPHSSGRVREKWSSNNRKRVSRSLSFTQDALPFPLPLLPCDSFV